MPVRSQSRQIALLLPCVLAFMPIKAKVAQDSSTSVVSYTLTPTVAQEPRRLNVTMQFAVPEGAKTVSLQMPVWSPGDYAVQNHAQYVENVKAQADEAGDVPQLVAVTHPDANTWNISTDKIKRLTVNYDVPTTPPGNFSDNVTVKPSYVFVNGPAALMYLVGHKTDPVRLHLILPSPDWKAEAPLPKESEAELKSENEAGITPINNANYAASDYDTLADTPLVMAAPNALKIVEFTASGKPHRIVFFNHADRIKNPDAYVPILRRIVEAETRIMGVTPYDRYEFCFDVDGTGGGLEHLNACRIAISSSATPEMQAAMFAHEFFHLWNVKRIRPRVLGPFDYVTPPKTRNLWFAEGVTEYYADIARRRAGFVSPEQFMRSWGRKIAAYERNPARDRVTADNASLNVWKTRSSEGYGGLSYYQKGELIGLCFDLTIRHTTEGKRSLDDVMRLLYARHHPPLPGYDEDELIAVLSEVAGQDMFPLYKQVARTVEDMPFAECLSYVGLDAQGRPLPNPPVEQILLRADWLRDDSALPAPMPSASKEGQQE